jgi:hypothetical protein
MNNSSAVQPAPYGENLTAGPAVDNSLYDALWALHMYSIPTICAGGVFGNVMSAWIFLGKQMRKTSCCVYLAARSVSDTGFLLSLFAVWLDSVHVRVFHTQVLCKIVVFMSYNCGFLSVWFVVYATFENYFRICRPTSVPNYCTTTRSCEVIAFTVMVSAFLYNFPLYASSIQIHNGVPYCHWHQRYGDLMQAVTYIDTFLTLVMPVIIILILMTAIMYNSFKVLRRQKRLRSVSGNSFRSRSPQQKLTRLLFAVSFLFIVLNTPNHVIRIKVMILSLVDGYGGLTRTDKTLQRMFELLYYFYFFLHFLIYLVAGKSFRNSFVSKLCAWRCVTVVQCRRGRCMTSSGNTGPHQTPMVILGAGPVPDLDTVEIECRL